MTDPIARQPKGIPAGGQFAAASHAEPDLSLAKPERPDQLEGWPESLPVPELDYGFMSDGQLETWVKAGDESFPVHTTDYDRGQVMVEIEPGSPLDDGAVRDQVREWAAKAHLEFEEGLRKEMEAAARAARHRLAAQITGVPARLEDAQLSEYAADCFSTGDDAVVEGERASVSLFARGVLEKHPAAHSVCFTAVEHEAGTTLTGFTVFDEAGSEIASSDRFDGEEDEALWDHVSSLKADSDTWDDFAPAHSDSVPSVDLRRAAGWAPGTRP